MKIKALMAIAIAFTTLTISVASCSKEEKETPAAEALAGTYSGDLTITVSESKSTDAASFVITKIDDSNVSLTIPAAGSGMMSLPSITVENIPAVRATVDGVEVVKASAEDISGTIIVNDVEKTYTFTEIVILGGDDNNVSINYTLQYGRMPFPMIGAFKGTRQ